MPALPQKPVHIANQKPAHLTAPAPRLPCTLSSLVPPPTPKFPHKAQENQDDPDAGQTRKKTRKESETDSKQICFSDDEDDTFLSSVNQRLIESFLGHNCDNDC